MDRHVYLIERYYIDRGHTDSLESEEALRETMLAVGEWCTHYRAELLVPRKSATEVQRAGELPSEQTEKRQFLLDLLEWISDNTDSAFRGTYNLMLDDGHLSPGASERDPKFTHFETLQWWLALTPDEFTKLQTAWRKKGLPEDLYYPEELHRWVEVEKTGWRKMIPGVIKKYYTPKYWELRKKEGQDK